MVAPLVGQPTLAEIKELLSVTTDATDEVIELALAAAVEDQRAALVFPVGADGPYYSPALKQALLLRVSRFVARRASPVGVVGFGEFGAVNIAGSDTDVNRLEARYRELRPW